MLVCDALPDSSCRSIPGTERRSFSGVGFRGGLNDFPAVLTHRPFEAVADAEHADTEDVEAWGNLERCKHLSRLLLPHLSWQFRDKHPCAPRRTQPWWEENWLGSRPSLGRGKCSAEFSLPRLIVLVNTSLVIERPSCSLAVYCHDATARRISSHTKPLAAGVRRRAPDISGLGFIRRPR